MGFKQTCEIRLALLEETAAKRETKNVDLRALLAKYLQRVTLPNYISILRILLVPVFLASIDYYVSLEKEIYRYLAIAVFSFASLSDTLDGYLARQFRQESRLGSILDPLADKLLLVAGIMALSLYHSPNLHSIPIWLTTLIVSRDAFLLIGIVLISYSGKTPRVQPKLLGKTATVAQMALILWALLKLPDAGFSVCVWLAGLLTLASGVQYFLDGLKQLNAADASPN